VIVDAAAYLDGKRASGDGSLGFDDLAAWLARPDVTVWIGLQAPTREEVAEAFAVLDLPATEVEPALSGHRRPVLSSCGSALWLVLRTASYDDQLEQVSLGELSVIVGTNFVLTMRHGHASPLDGLRTRLEREGRFLRHGPTAVLAAVAHQVIDDYAPALDGFENDAVQVEQDVFSEERQRQPIQRLYRLKREVRRLLLVIDALQDPLERLVGSNGEHLSKPVRTSLRESLENLDRVLQRTHVLAELLTAALNAAMAQVSMQQNEDMRKISAWVAIGVVPTMMAGIYGMNFEHMPELSWRLGYPMAVGSMATICLLLYRAFRRSGWL
jgi:magnesium transporter